MNYASTLNSFPEIIFLIIFIIAMGILLYTFGSQMVKDKNVELKDTGFNITSEQVTQYFIDNGYLVCDVSQTEEENKWLGYLIKNGEFSIATAFTNGESVESHQDSLATMKV